MGVGEFRGGGGLRQKKIACSEKVCTVSCQNNTIQRSNVFCIAFYQGFGQEDIEVTKKKKGGKGLVNGVKNVKNFKEAQCKDLQISYIFLPKTVIQNRSCGLSEYS